MVVDTLQAIVDGKTTRLVDVSVLGAQVTSEPVLKPNQRIKIALPDRQAPLRRSAATDTQRARLKSCVTAGTSSSWRVRPCASTA
jgi:hypothetical protein